VIALAAAAAVPYLQRGVDRAGGQWRGERESLYLWNGAQVKRIVPGFEQLAGDIYWLRTVQYFGAERAYAAEKRFDLLYPLVEITTTLDPRLEIAYRYGSVFLAEPIPVGAGRPDLGLAVLERGVASNPLSWRLRQELGFYHFVYLHDARRAAEILTDASRIPGAAFWLKNLAADILAKGGERDISRRMWREMYDNAEEGAIKENAKVHLQVLDAVDAADALNAAVGQFEKRTGRLPRALAEIADAGLVPRRALVDPAGIPYEYDAGTGQASVARASPLRRDDLMGEDR
jgi:hypothetical protein